MLPSLYIVEEASNGGVVAIMRRPSSDWLVDDIAKLSEEGITHIVSLLTEPEVIELGLQSEPNACKSSGIHFLSFPVVDRGVPENSTAFILLLNKLALAFEAGARIAVHCRAGIGRSGLSAAALLVTQGMTSEEAFARVSDRRRITVPDTDDQRIWLETHIDALQR